MNEVREEEFKALVEETLEMASILHYIYLHLRQPKGLQSTLLLKSGRKPLACEDEANT